MQPLSLHTNNKQQLTVQATAHTGRNCKAAGNTTQTTPTGMHAPGVNSTLSYPLCQHVGSEWMLAGAGEGPYM